MLGDVINTSTVLYIEKYDTATSRCSLFGTSHQQQTDRLCFHTSVSTADMTTNINCSLVSCCKQMAVFCQWLNKICKTTCSNLFWAFNKAAHVNYSFSI